MADALFELARQKFLGATLDWDGQTFSAVLLDLNTADVGNKLISSSTNATPIVVTTTTAHGYTNGDVVYIGDHLVNTAGNGLWVITAASGSVFSLTDPITGGNAVGNGVGTTSGYAVNLGPSTSADFFDDFDACLVGAKVNLAGETIVQGIANATSPITFTAVSGATVEAVAIIRDTGTNSTSEMVCLITGRQIVTCAATAAASATTVPVERLRGPIANGSVLAFSNGASATLSAGANAGDRTLTVSALAAQITAGSRALANINGSGLPVTPNGGNIVLSLDTGANKIFKL